MVEMNIFIDPTNFNIEPVTAEYHKVMFIPDFCFAERKLKTLAK